MQCKFVYAAAHYFVSWHFWSFSLTFLVTRFFFSKSLETISKWPNADSYDNFAYHIELLVVFSSNDTAKAITGSAGRKLSRRGSFRRVNSYTAKASGGTMFMSGSNTSLRSSSSVKSWTRPSAKNGSNHKVGGAKRSNSTVQGSNVFANTLRKGHSKSVKANSSTHSR